MMLDALLGVFVGFGWVIAVIAVIMMDAQDRLVFIAVWLLLNAVLVQLESLINEQTRTRALLKHVISALAKRRGDAQ